MQRALYNKEINNNSTLAYIVLLKALLKLKFLKQSTRLNIHKGFKASVLQSINQPYCEAK